MTKTTVLFAKGKSDQEARILETNMILFMTNLFIKEPFKYIVIIFHGMEYVTVNIEET